TVHSEGTVTFERIGAHDEAQPDAPPPASPPATPPPAPPAETGKVELPTGHGDTEIARDGSELHVRVQCGLHCGGVRLNVYGHNTGSTMCGIHIFGAGRPAHRRRLATKRVTVPDGGSRLVKFRFGRSARRAILRAGGVQIEVVAGSVRRTVTVN